jgi:CBS domain-containing protein
MRGTTSHPMASCPLESQQSRDLMSPNPVSLRRDATVQDAITLLSDRGFGAAPVIDEGGRPIGVVSRTDILIHDREQARHPLLEDDTEWDMVPRRPWPLGFSVENANTTPVEEIMTPAVFTVALDTSARDVIQKLLELKIHQLFVVDDLGSMVGVISALDVLRHL